jgi:adenylate cyclase
MDFPAIGSYTSTTLGFKREALVAPQNTVRRLAAILSADVVGYSRLMGMDEAGTLGALRAHRGELIDPTIVEHHGRVVKLLGDGLLVEFASAIDAVACAIAIQQGMAVRNTDVPPERMIVFRIGINLGDVIIDGDDIYGDGVNVAARLQELAAPGGVFLSGAIFEQVDGKVDQNLTDLGNQQFKNINRLVRVYSVRFPGLSSDTERRPMLDLASSKKVPVAGGCLCGEIRYRVTEPALDTCFCHCRMCQRFSGAPVTVGSTYSAGAVQFTKGEPKYYKSSLFAERGFCANCGSSLTYRPVTPAVSPAWEGWILIYTPSLDNPAPNVPTWHLGVESQMPWLDIQCAARKRVRCQDSPDIVEAWGAFNLPVP